MSKRGFVLLETVITVIAVAVIIGGIAYERGHTAAPTERLLGRAPVFAPQCWTPQNYVPPGCIFGSAAVQAVVLSSYANESNLIGARQPVGDYDYLLGNGNQESVRLPGGSWNRYSYYGAVYVQGSGCVLEFGTPTGGRFAYLHMSQTSSGCGASSTRAQNAVRGGAPHLPGSKNLSGDEQTALRVQQIIGVPTVASGSRVGGHIVGLSRWPDWTIYGNGSCCQADAHLCVVLDSTARAWFLHVASGADKPPWRFPWTAWKSWTSTHHKPTISPWRSRSCAGKKACLTWPASIFPGHRHLGGKKPGDRWFHPRGQHGYMKYLYASGVAYAWPSNHAVKIVIGGR